MTSHSNSRSNDLKRVARLALATGACCVALAGVARASVLYVTPDGSASDAHCATPVFMIYPSPKPPTTPCEIHHAIAVAQAGDEVIVESGDYDLSVSGDVVIDKPLNLHGSVAGPQRPSFSGAGFQVTSGANTGGNMQLADLMITQRGSEPALYVDASGLYQRLFLESTFTGTQASPGTALSIGPDPIGQNSVYVLDTIAAATSNGYETAILSDAPAIANPLITSDTAIAVGSNPVAIENDAHSQLVVRSAIAYATYNNGQRGVDLKALYGSINVAGSNYSGVDGTIVDAGANQTNARPALDSSYHEYPDSPTISAGGSLGQFPPEYDIDGEQRVVSGKVDIGADEYLPPPASTLQAATDVHAISATLHATINPNGVDTTYHFVYGPPQAGVNGPSVDVGSGNSPTSVSLLVTGLKPSTLYNFALAATNVSVDNPGSHYADPGLLQFTTPPLPPNTTPPANTAPPVITGAAQQGATLTATPGTWSGTGPLSYSYQWRDCDASGANCGDIPGATGTSDTLVHGDLGHTLRVSVTASNAAGSAVVESAPTATVTSPPSPPPLKTTGLSLLASRFAADRGTALTLTLSLPATVDVLVTQTVRGHEVNHRCKAGASRGGGCRLTIRRTERTFSGVEGRNTFKLQLRGLAPGRYSANVSARATDGSASTPVTIGFTITRPRRSCAGCK
jgi:hypothetical protein